jgi:sigma-B regulation protein RsbU (phosphoserine phosphatase)
MRNNRDLVNDARTGLFVTAFLAELDPQSGGMRYASAGHEPPLVLRRGEPVPDELPLAPSELLGAFGDFAATDSEVLLESGDLLLAYTDGVTDAKDANGLRFGDDRLRGALRRGAASGADGAIAAVLDALDEFVAAEPATDDVTLLAVEALAR